MEGVEGLEVVDGTESGAGLAEPDAEDEEEDEDDDAEAVGAESVIVPVYADSDAVGMCLRMWKWW